MNCSECREIVSRSHLTKTEPPAAVRAHIADCGSCRQALNASDQLESMLSRTTEPKLKVSPDLHQRIIDEIEETKQPSPLRGFRLAPVAVAAALLLALGAVLYFNDFDAAMNAERSTSAATHLIGAFSQEQQPALLMLAASEMAMQPMEDEVLLFKDDLDRAARFCGAMLAMNAE